ncbi:MAG: type III-B CRISPR module RAMP protein Cmr6 [Candidatus Cloacimonetes bacterium]|nr:type III-B CRISPR module RAMP protein Cmr6 [Candidatus Cloacimonadota bacterium]
MNELYIPKDTLEVFDDKPISSNFNNINLLLNKFPHFNGKKFTIYDSDKRNPYDVTTKLKNEVDLINSAYLCSQIRQVRLQRKEFCLKPDWRFVVGLGGESVFETSITLHHIYGFPYIPGQALKGVLRNYIINEYFAEELEKAKDSKELDNEVEKDNLFSFIFGNQKQQGKVVFFDALPVTKPKIEKDVINPHYTKYYSGALPPADHFSPIPVFFLMIKDTSFVFNIGIKGKDIDECENKCYTSTLWKEITEKGLMAFLECITIEALSVYGIGAKTSVGYGSFRNEEKIPVEFEKLVSGFKSNAELAEESIIGLIANIKNNCCLYNIQEALKRLTEDLKNSQFKQELLKVILDSLTKKENYERLKANNQHYELIKYGLEFKKYLVEQERQDIMCRFDTGFNKCVKEFAGKRQKVIWKSF